jgi:hypothetical protein
MCVVDLVLCPFEIRVAPHVGYGHKGFCKALSFGTQQEFFEQDAMFGFHTPAMSCGTLFQGINDMLIEVSDDEIGHDGIGPY